MPSYEITVGTSFGKEKTLRAFRQEIMRGLHMNPHGAAASPLSCAFHGYCEDKQTGELVAWNEWFFYDQMFTSYHDAIYCLNSNLAAYDKPGRIIHHRSSYVTPRLRRSFLFLDMVLACATACKKLGATYCTVSTLQSDRYLVQLYQGLGFKKLGLFPVEGRQHQLLIVQVDHILAHPRLSKAKRKFAINELMLQKIRYANDFTHASVASGK